MDPTTAERLVANEHRFREVNERLEADVRAIAAEGERLDFVCECSSTSCREAVALSLPEFTALREAVDRFAVVPGHDVPEIERVVERTDRYFVVKKR